MPNGLYDGFAQKRRKKNEKERKVGKETTKHAVSRGFHDGFANNKKMKKEITKKKSSMTEKMKEINKRAKTLT